MNKKSTLSIFGSVLFASLHLSAQVPNPGFENWTSGNPDGWFVTNVAGLGIPVTQYSPGHSGSSAAKGQPVIMLTGDTLTPAILSGTPGSGFPISQSYTTLEFYYQCNLTGGDLFSFDVYIYNASNTVIAASNEDISLSTTGWTMKTIAINYFGSGTATKAVIQFTLLPSTLTGAGYPNTSSTFMVDDVMLSGTVGVQENSYDSMRTDVFPNPANTDAAINISNSVTGNAELFLYDLKGSVVKQLFTNMTEKNFKWKFSVADLPQGIYAVRIVSGKKQWLSRFVKV